MAAKRRGYTRRLIKRNALGQFARVAGSGRKAGRRAGGFARSRVARTKMGRRLTVDRLYHQGIKSSRRRLGYQTTTRRGINFAKGSALRVQMAHKQRQRKKLQTSILNYYVHGKQDRTFRRQARKIRRGR